MADWKVIEHSDYHLERLHFSASQIKVFQESPTKFFNLYIRRNLRPLSATSAMNIGTCVHDLFLNEEESFIEYPPECMNAKGNLLPAKKEKFLLENRGKIVIKPSEASQVRATVASLRNSLVSQWRDGAEKLGHIEDAIFDYEGVCGIPVKCKPDFAFPTSDGKYYVIDLKVTDPRPSAVRRHIRSFKAWIQMAHYRLMVSKATGVDLDDVHFYFVAVRPEPSHEVSVIGLDEGSTQLAQDQYIETMQKLSESIENEEWSADWQTEIQELQFSYFD